MSAAPRSTEPATRQAEVNLADALSRLRDALNVHASQLIAWGNQAEEIRVRDEVARRFVS